MTQSSERPGLPPQVLQVNDEDWRNYRADPLPGWGCRSMTLFDTRSARLDEEARADCGIFSVPFDSTASSRIGSREGPRGIREASLVYSSQLRSRGASELTNTRTGDRVRIRERDLVDFGDCHVYPSDPERQVRATAAESYRVASRSDLTVMLGGEHTLSFPAYCGVASALRRRGKTRLGYVQIDHHFDFGEHSVLHGPYYHGSNARRISEHPSASPETMGFVGAGDLTRTAQLEQLLRSGTSVRTMADIRRDGFSTALCQVLDRVAGESDALYVSLDIDVCDSASAPGTGHVTIGGLSSHELFLAPAILQRYPVAAFDIMEVSPRYDAAGVTCHLAARFLFEWLFLQPVTG
jgi:arginase family enzyme